MRRVLDYLLLESIGRLLNSYWEIHASHFASMPRQLQSSSTRELWNDWRLFQISSRLGRVSENSADLIILHGLQQTTQRPRSPCVYALTN